MVQPAQHQPKDYEPAERLSGQYGRKASKRKAYGAVHPPYKKKGTFGTTEDGWRLPEKVLGKEHPDTAASYNNIASVYQKQGEYKKAVGLCLRSYKTYAHKLGVEHPYTKTVYKNLERAFTDSKISDESFQDWLDGQQIE